MTRLFKPHRNSLPPPTPRRFWDVFPPGEMGRAAPVEMASSRDGSVTAHPCQLLSVFVPARSVIYDGCTVRSKQVIPSDKVSLVFVLPCGSSEPFVSLSDVPAVNVRKPTGHPSPGWCPVSLPEPPILSCFLKGGPGTSGPETKVSTIAVTSDPRCFLATRWGN